MSSIVIAGDTSGSVTIAAPAIAGTTVITLPATTGTLISSGGALGTPSSGTLTSCTGLPMTTGVTGTLPIANGGTNSTATAYCSLTTNISGTLPVANGGTGVTSSTGSGANVLGTSPTLTTPILGTPTSGNLANCTGIPAPAALSTASGSAPSYSARAWVNFNGAGTVAIRASGNVSSITDNGTGDYTVNFTTAMSDANYSVSGVCNLNTTGNFGDFLGGPFNQAPTTSAWRCLVVTYDGGTVDPVYATIAFFR